MTLSQAEIQRLDKRALLAEIEKIREQRSRRRVTARRHYVPYSSLSPSQKRKRLGYGQKYRMKQRAVIEIAREAGLIQPDSLDPIQRSSSRRLRR